MPRGGVDEDRAAGLGALRTRRRRSTDSAPDFTESPGRVLLSECGRHTRWARGGRWASRCRALPVLCEPGDREEPRRRLGRLRPSASSVPRATIALRFKHLPLAVPLRLSSLGSPVELGSDR